MKLGVVGATGASGAALVEQALAADHEVFVVARRPEAVEPRKALRITPGDATDVDALAAGFAGADAVVNLVGVSGLLAARRGTTIYSRSARALVEASKTAGFHRLIAVTSGGVEPQPGDGWFYTNILKRHFLEPTYTDMRVAEEVLRTSELAWTIVRPGYLTGDRRDATYRTVVDGPIPNDGSLSRWNLAHAILHQALDPKLIRHTLAVAT
jgi:uncharacterized protein YbjT (DUF2867 family)